MIITPVPLRFHIAIGPKKSMENEIRIMKKSGWKPVGGTYSYFSVHEKVICARLLMNAVPNAEPRVMT